MKMKSILASAIAVVCLLAALPLCAALFDGGADDAIKQLRWEHGPKEGWSLQSGVITLAPGKNDGLRIGISDACTPADGYRISARLKFADPKSGGHAGFQVRRTGGKTCYVHLTPTGTYLGMSGAYDKLMETMFKNAPDGIHKLDIEVARDAIKVFVDGVEKLSAKGLPGDAAGAAFFAFKTDVEYRDVTIEALTAPPTASPAETKAQPAAAAAVAAAPSATPPEALFDGAAEDAVKQLRWEHGPKEGWSLKAGTLSLDPGQEGGLRIGISDACTPADGYRISARLKFPDPSSGGHAGFQVRRTGGKACYVHLAPSGTYIGMTGASEKLMETRFKNTADGVHKLEVEVTRDTIRAFVDGEQALFAEKLSGDAAGAAFSTYKTAVEFSDITIRPLAAEPEFVLPKTSRRGFMVSELTPEIVKAIKEDWHANIVRLQLIPLFWAPKKGISHAEAWKWMMEQLPGWLDNARDAGILVVIDLHNVPRPYPVTKIEKQSAAMFWSDISYRQLFLECWNEIAHICKDRPEEIWFDLMNEPLNWLDMPSYPKAWPDWAQAAIDVIRVTDKTHHIVIEPGPGGLCWGFKDFKPLRDPMDKLIYSAHQYQPHIYAMQGIRDITGTDLSQAYLERGKHWPGNYDDSDGGWWDKKRIEEKEMACVIEFQRKYHARIFIGEFSVCRWAPEGAQFLDDCISIFEKYGWDWTYHAFRESRIWSLEHENTYTSEPKLATTPPDRAVVVHKYMDQNLQK